MSNPSALPIVNDDIDAAINLLGRLKMTQTDVLAALHAHANAASAAGNSALDLELTRKAIDLSRENLRIANAIRAARRAGSLSGPIERLREIVRDAEALRQNLDNVAKALAAAERLIGILRRLTGLFG